MIDMPTLEKPPLRPIGELLADTAEFLRATTQPVQGKDRLLLALDLAGEWQEAQGKKGGIVLLKKHYPELVVAVHDTMDAMWFRGPEGNNIKAELAENMQRYNLRHVANAGAVHNRDNPFHPHFVEHLPPYNLESADVGFKADFSTAAATIQTVHDYLVHNPMHITNRRVLKMGLGLAAEGLAESDGQDLEFLLKPNHAKLIAATLDALDIQKKNWYGAQLQTISMVNEEGQEELKTIAWGVSGPGIEFRDRMMKKLSGMMDYTAAEWEQGIREVAGPTHDNKFHNHYEIKNNMRPL